MLQYVTPVVGCLLFHDSGGELDHIIMLADDHIVFVPFENNAANM